MDRNRSADKLDLLILPIVYFFLNDLVPSIGGKVFLPTPKYLASKFSDLNITATYFTMRTMMVLAHIAIQVVSSVSNIFQPLLKPTFCHNFI